MKRRLFTLFLVFVFAMAMMPDASAFFTRSHLYWSLKGMNDVSSSVTSMCAPYKAQVVDGNTAADVPVLHYFDDKFMSYIGTHTRGSGYWACLEAAGSDLEQRCMCVGVGLHIVQDTFAHTEGGIVPKYLKSSGSSNLFGHMIIERDFEVKHMKYLEQQQDEILLSGELDYFDDHVLCSFMEPVANEDGVIVCPDAPGDKKYAKLLEKMSGLNMINDLNIFHSGYLGQGFYQTVYNEKIKLPFWFYGMSIGLVILGLGIAAIVGITGKTKFKWALVAEFTLVFLVGAIILGAFLSHNTWQVTEVILEVPPKLGMLSISDQDIVDYNRAAQEATNQFLNSGGQLVYDDATGLSYLDRNGQRIEGALYEAEKTFLFGIFPVLVLIFLVFNSFLFIKTYKLKVELKGGKR